MTGLGSLDEFRSLVKWFNGLEDLVTAGTFDVVTSGTDDKEPKIDLMIGIIGPEWRAAQDQDERDLKIMAQQTDSWVES